MRWIRLIMALITARTRTELGIHDSSRLHFRVWITDIDVSIMNHAALMTVMEAGRVDYMVRSGFFKLARKNKWYVPSAAISVQFIRPLKIFQKAELVTRVIHVNDQWIYLEQKVTRKGRDIANAIVKSTIKKGRERLNMYEVVKQLGHGDWPQYDREMLEQYELHLQQLNGQRSTDAISA